MKAKQDGVLEKADARPAGDYGAAGKRAMSGWIWVIGMALSIAALPAAAEQHSSGGEVKKEAGRITHQGKGKVVAVDKAGLTVKLTHEEIKSLGWPAMTMGLKVASAALLEGLKAGDKIAFELGQDGKPGGWQITRITLY